MVGQDRLRPHLAQRRQHETSLVRPGMRQLQLPHRGDRASRRIGDGDQVQVQGAGAPLLSPGATGRRFDAVQVGQDLLGGEGGVDDGHGVQVAVLVGAADGCRLVQARPSHHRPQGLERLQRPAHEGDPITQVRAEGDGGPIRHLRRCTVTVTSRKGTAMGAWGLWTVTVTASIRPSSIMIWATREATFSIRFQRSPSTRR